MRAIDRLSVNYPQSTVIEVGIIPYGWGFFRGIILRE